MTKSYRRDHSCCNNVQKYPHRNNTDDSPYLKNITEVFYLNTSDYKSHDSLSSGLFYSYKMYVQFSDVRQVSNWKAYLTENHNPAAIKAQFCRKASVFPKKSYSAADGLTPDE